MAKLNSRLLVALLLATTAAVSSAGQESPLMLGMAARSAGCHQHGAKPPASTPVSYRCCQSGHDSAILQTSFTVRFSSARLVPGDDSIPTPVEHATQSCFRGSTISSPDPPATIPLRV